MEAMASTLPHPAHLKTMPRLAFVLAAALLLGMLAHLGWQGFGFYKQLRQAVQAPQAATSVVAEPERREPSAALMGLFGAGERDSELAEQQNTPLPESNLNLQVSAIFFVTPVEQSSVIIEDGDQTKTLKRGEEVRPGIVVQRIQSDRVTLKRNGKLEQISFRGYAEGAATTPQAIAQQPPREDATESAAPAASPPGLSTAYQQFIQRKLAQPQ